MAVRAADLALQCSAHPKSSGLVKEEVVDRGHSALAVPLAENLGDSFNMRCASVSLTELSFVLTPTASLFAPEEVTFMTKLLCVTLKTGKKIWRAPSTARSQS